MKKTTLTLGVMAFIVGATLISAGTALAYRGDPAVKGPNYSEQRHEAMQKAFENNDYAAWRSQMPATGRAAQLINADNFAKFAEANRLAVQGNSAEAQKIRQELGLGLHKGAGQGQGQGRTGGCANR